MSRDISKEECSCFHMLNGVMYESLLVAVHVKAGELKIICCGRIIGDISKAKLSSTERQTGANITHN